MVKKAAGKLLSLLLAATLCISQGASALASSAEGDEIKVSVSELRGAKGRLEAPQHFCLQGKGKKDVTAWSYVYFGSYPQQEVKGSALTAAIKNASYDGNGDAWVNGTRYRRVDMSVPDYPFNFGNQEYRFFKWEKIRWRVLSDAGSSLIVMADQALDSKSYHDKYENVTWEKSTLRQWMNGTFLQTAFSSQEQNAILNEKLTNSKNPDFATSAGSNTVDKIFPLSIQETAVRGFGFCESDEDSASRQAKASDYAYVMGADRNASGYCEWWLRSPGSDNTDAAYVGEKGNQDTMGNFVHIWGRGCVPALVIRRSSSLWKKAPSPVKAPAGLKASIASGDAVKLTWKKVKGAKSYQIYRYEANDDWAYAVKTVKKTSFTDQKLKGGKTYYYYVVAYSGANVSFPSKEVSKKVVGKLAAPKMTMKADSAARKFTISWNTVKHASKMQILRATGNGAYRKWRTVSARKKTVSYSYGELQTGTQYRFALRAYYKVGKKTIYSDMSNAMSFKLTR